MSGLQHPLFGTRAVDSTGKPGQYHWMSYKQACLTDMLLTSSADRLMNSCACRRASPAHISPLRSGNWACSLGRRLAYTQPIAEVGVQPTVSS